MPFTGFSPKTFAFLAALEKNNRREWWAEHKTEYIEYVKNPMTALSVELGHTFGTPHVFRPNRDIRFTPDKTPYKTNASFFITAFGPGGLYLEITKNRLYIGGGIYEPMPEQLITWRKLFDAPKRKFIKKFLYEVEKDDFLLIREGELKTAPRGWKKDHPEIEFLRLKHIALGRGYDIEEWMMDGKAALKILTADFEIIEKWNALLNKYVGSPKTEMMWSR